MIFGIVTPKIDFTSVVPGDIAVGSYLLGFDTNNSGKLSKMDSSLNLSVLESAVITASVLEINTGTDNVKYISPLGLEGSKYVNQSLSKISATASGTNTYTASLTPAITSYAGQKLFINFTNTNSSTTPTLNVNGLGARTIVNADGSALVASQLKGIVLLADNGTNFQIVGGSGTGGTSALTSAHIFVGNASNVATDVALSGDATISNTGTLTVAATIVKSVVLNTPSSIFTNPVTFTTSTNTATGTLALATQAQNSFFAAPSTGGAGTPTFRAIVPADIPTLNQNTTGNAATVTTNANLTGPITSVGNATSVASQTGTGSTFVMSNSPTLVTPNLGTPSAGNLVNATGYTEANLSTSDITTNNVSITKHGFAPKAPNDATKYLDGTGVWSVPAGSGGSTALNNGFIFVGNASNIATGVAMSGDASISNSGILTVANGVVKTVVLNTPSSIFTTPVNFTTSTSIATGTLALATQTAGTVLAGPITGSAAAPTFRALSPSDMPNLTNQRIGTIFTDTFTSASNYIQGIFFGSQTFNSGYVTLTGSNNSFNSNYMIYKYNATSVLLNDYTLTCRFISTANANTYLYGFAIGINTYNGPVGNPIYAVRVNTSSGINRGQISVSSAFSLIETSITNLTYANTDTLELSVRVISTKFYITFKNITTTTVNVGGVNIPNIVTLECNADSESLTNHSNRMGRPIIWTLDGTQQVYSLSMSSEAFQNPQFVIAGDYRAVGYGASVLANSYASLIGARAHKTSVWGRGDVTTVDLTANISELTALCKTQKTYVLLSVGVNDAIAAKSLSQFQIDYVALLQAIIAMGGIPIISKITYVGASYPSQSTINTLIGNYNAWLTTLPFKQVDEATTMTGGGGNLLAAYTASDNLNYNDAGHNAAANVLLSQLVSLSVIDQNITWNGSNFNVPGKLMVGGLSTTSHSTLQSAGSVAFPYTTKTANYTITANDFMIYCTTNSFTLTLPSAVGIAGRVYWVKNITSGTTVSVATILLQTIDGVAGPASVTGSNGGNSVAFMSTGSNWILLSYIPPVIQSASTAEINAGTDSTKVIVSQQLQGSKYEVQGLSKITATASGTDTYTATLSPAITSYAGQKVFINFTNTNTSTTPTLNLNGLGARTIINANGNPLTAGQLQGIVCLADNGTNFQIIGNTPTVTTPIATVSDINTGTDNTKQVTALGLQGSKYLDQYFAKVSAISSNGDTYTATLTPAITTYAGLKVYIDFRTGSNTVINPTMNINGLGAIPILNSDGSFLTPNILTGVIQLIYEANSPYAMANSPYFKISGVTPFYASSGEVNSGLNSDKIIPATALAGSDYTKYMLNKTTGIASGTNTYTVSLTSAITGYQLSLSSNGIKMYIYFLNTNTTTTPTLNINGIGARNIVNSSGAAVNVGQLKGMMCLYDNGSSFEIVSDNLIPTIATVSDVNTGTDNAKQVTALSLQTSKYETQGLAKITATASGTDTYTATLSPAITSYAGQKVFINFNNTNTSTTPTLNLNTLGARTIVNADGTALVAGQLKGIVCLADNGTNFQVIGANMVSEVPATIYTAAWSTQTLVNAGTLYYFVNASDSTAKTINLPLTPTFNNLVIIKDKKGDAATNNITISGNGKLIDGVASITINKANQAYTLKYDGTDWNII